MKYLQLHHHLPSYGTEDRTRPCRVCASRGAPAAFHKHFSTNYLRQRCIAAGSNLMECPVCQDLHTTDLLATPRVKAFFSSSTCNGFWKDPSWEGTEKYHIDVEAVGGLKILAGRRMWQQLYHDLPTHT